MTAGVSPPIFLQAITAEFIRQAHLARHIRRMRRLYNSRLDVLLEELHTQLDDKINIGPTDCGMHLVIWLPDEIDDKALAEKLPRSAAGAPLRHAYINKPTRPGLILSFASTNKEQIRRDVRLL